MTQLLKGKPLDDAVPQAFHLRQRSGAAEVNDMPGACQSRGVTEPQRDWWLGVSRDG